MSTFGIGMSPKQLVDILSESYSELRDIREEDIRRPTPEKTSKIYWVILSYIGAVQDDDGQADFNALEQLENPDFHTESVRVCNLAHKIRELVAAIGVEEYFMLKDLIKPDGQRNFKFLSALANYYCYRVEKMSHIQTYMDEVNKHEEHRQELQTKISELNNEKESLNGANESEQPYVQQLEGDISKLRQKIYGLNSHQRSLKDSLNTLKDKTTEIEEKISKANFALVRSAQETAELQSKIVQSPDKLQAALEEKKSILVKANNLERSARQSFQDKTSTLEVYTKAFKKMSKHLVQMQAIQEQVDSAKQIDKDSKALKSKLSNEKVLDMSLEAQLVERHGKVEQLEESLKAFEKERDSKYDEATKELNKVKLGVESKKRDNSQKQEKITALVEKAAGINVDINLVKEAGESKQQELLKKAELIYTEFHSYRESSRAVMQQIETSLKGSTEIFSM